MNSAETGNPKVSILIPVFNREKLIAECIRSAINQDFSDYEIVVVDNCSTDKTWEIVLEFSSAYENVRAFRNNANIGPVKNWHRCISESKGKYCKFLFSDDLLFPDCLGKLYDSMCRSNFCFTFSQVRTGESIENSRIHYCNYHSESVTREEYFFGLLSGTAPVSPGAVLIERELLLNCLKFDFNTSTPRDYISNGAGPDVMIMLLAYISNQYAGYVNEPLSFFRTHNDSFTTLNENNAVAFGYISVLSLYAKQNFSFFNWVHAVSKLWLKFIYKTKRIVSPVEFFKEYEGTGSAKEILPFFLIIPFVAIREAYRRTLGPVCSERKKSARKWRLNLNQ